MATQATCRDLLATRAPVWTSIFQDLARRAGRVDRPEPFDVLLRLAFRAQSACRAMAPTGVLFLR
jgi:hypothetical protein